MVETLDRVALKARYLFPVASAPLRDGVVTIEDGRIVAVGQNRSERPPRDLGNVAILPGLVNAHTHLEFSTLSAPLGKEGICFPDWVREVVVRRRRESDQAADTAARNEAVAAGLEESAGCGTAALADIATPGWPEEPYRRAPIDCTVFQELIGLSPERAESRLHLARQHLEKAKVSQGGWRPGLSPHAPYSVHVDLVRRICALSAERRVPVAMHLAESLEEIELLLSAGGPFRQVLEELDVWEPTAIPRGIRPLDYLQLLAGAHRALVIHGNFLSDEEIRFLAQHSDRMSVVYCPGTHRYFQHGAYPLQQMLQAGVHVACGTDSRASNPDLSVLGELRLLARTHPDVPLDVVLRLGTLAGARALGIDKQWGSLAVGKRAALACVALPDREDEPHRLLFDSTAPARPVPPRDD